MRNSTDPYEPCPCGSGKKYKFCCSARDRRERRDSVAASGFWARENGGGDLDDPVVLDLDNGERLNNEGMALLQRYKFDAAIDKFKASIEAAPLIPAGWNNLALTTFFAGRVEEAISIQESALRKIPVPNYFGQAQLIHLYLAMGRDREATRIADELLTWEPSDEYGAGKACESFARLKRHQDVVRVIDRFPGPLSGALCYFAGMACANLGRFEKAIDYLERIPRWDLYRSRGQTFVKRLRNGQGPGTLEGQWPCFDPGEILPPELVKTLGDSDKRKKRPAIESALMGSTLLVDYLEAIFNQTEGRESLVAAFLSDATHPRAVALLQKIAEGTLGSDNARLEAFHALCRKGVWAPGEPHKIWLKGEWTEISGQLQELDEEAASADFAPELMPLYEEATCTLQDGHFEKSEKLWRRFIEKAPDHFPAYHNLAVALMRQGLDEEAEEYLLKALELKPDYLFAPCTLALLYMHQDRLREARERLDGIKVPKVAHPQAMLTYWLAQTQVCMAEGNVTHAMSWLDMAVRLDPNEPNVRLLQKIFSNARAIHGWFEDMKARQREKSARLRERVLLLDASLDECYGAYSKSQLTGMARAIGLKIPSNARKPVFLREICEALARPETVRTLLKELKPDELDAVLEVVKNGRREDFEAFTRKHGADAGDSPQWDDRPPQTLLGRLKCHGLLVEATVDRRMSVFVPAMIPVSY